MPRSGIPATLVALGLAVGLATPAQSQDVEYTTVTKVELGGILGAFAKLAGGGGETTEKTYIKGAKMRTDLDKSSSTILDFEAGRVIEIDHSAKTFTILSFEQMLAAAERAAGEANAAAREARAEEPEGEVKFKYTMKVDPTNERQKVNGYDARRYFMTMETDITVESEEQEEEQAGKLVIFADMWNATNVPAEQAMKGFQEKAPGLARRSQKSMDNMAAALASNPGMQSAIEESTREASKLEGFTVRGTTYVVMVPPELQFDREMVLSPKPKASTGDAVKRGIGGMLRGRLGAEQKKEEEEEPAPEQMTFVKLFSETKDMKSTNLSDALFAPPSGYKEVPLPTGN